MQLTNLGLTSNQHPERAPNLRNLARLEFNINLNNESFPFFNNVLQAIIRVSEQTSTLEYILVFVQVP